MASISKSIEVELPVSTVYDQWTQFEEFPKFMSGVVSVTQLSDKRLRWRSHIAGRTEEWEAEILEQVPDEKIAWRSTEGAENAGLVTFDKVGENRTRVHLELFYDPKGIAENVGAALGIVSARVSGDLQRFKEFIESRGVESGAWRGEIHHGVVNEPEPAGTVTAPRGEVGPDVTGVRLHGGTAAGAAGASTEGLSAPGPVADLSSATGTPTAETLPTRRTNEEDEIAPEP